MRSQHVFTLCISAGVLFWAAQSAQAEDAPPAKLDEPAALEQEFRITFVQPSDLNAAQPDQTPPVRLPSLAEFADQPFMVPAPVVYSASRREERAPDAPATVIVIEREDIVLRGYSQLTDVLRDLPGMETIEYYFSEFGTQVPIRGISGNNKIVVLVNGMRVNPPGGENFPFRSDFSVRFAERIEVVYGSASTLYGEDAISAIINVVMREPEGGSSIEIGAEAGLNFQREAWGWYAGELGCCRQVKLSGFVQYHDSNLTPLASEFPGYWADYANVAASKTNANGAGVVPERWDFGLNAYGRIECRNNSFQVWYRESQRSSSEGFNTDLGFLPQAKWGDYTLAMEGKNIAEFHDNWTLESRITYRRYEINPSSRFVFPATPTEWFLDDFKYGRGWGLSLNETLRWDVNDRFTILVGGLARYRDIIPKATFNGGFDPSMDPLAQGGFFQYSTVPAGALTQIPQVNNVRFWTYAVFGEGQLQLTDRLRLVGGVRATWDGHFDDVPVMPRASAILNATDRFTIKYMYSQGFVQPAPYFAFAPFDNGTLLATTNPNVQAETAETHELNLSYNSEDIMLGLSFYHGTQSDIITVADRAAPQNIIQDPVYLNGLAGQPRTLVQTANGGESERFGIDLYGTWRCGCMKTWFSYSYVDFHEVNGGIVSGLPGISKHNGRLGTTWQASCRFFITPSLVIRSTPENVVPGTLARQYVDPWEVNLYMLYRYSPGMDFFVDLRNITDHDYALGGFTGNAIPQETFRGVAGVRFMY